MGFFGFNPTFSSLKAVYVYLSVSNCIRCCVFHLSVPSPICTMWHLVPRVVCLYRAQNTQRFWRGNNRQCHFLKWLLSSLVPPVWCPRPADTSHPVAAHTTVTLIYLWKPNSWSSTLLLCLRSRCCSCETFSGYRFSKCLLLRQHHNCYKVTFPATQNK